MLPLPLFPRVRLCWSLGGHPENRTDVGSADGHMEDLWCELQGWRDEMAQTRHKRP